MILDFSREFGKAGDRREETSAVVAMVHSVPELIVSKEVCTARHSTVIHGYRLSY